MRDHAPFCRCCAAYKEWEGVLALLTVPEDPPDHTPPVTPTPKPTSPQADIPIHSLGNVESATLVLRGRAHEGLGDFPSAVECYKQALLCDVYCEEAWSHLTQHHALTEGEELALLDAMPFKSQCSVSEEEMLRLLYAESRQHLRKAAPSPASSAHLEPLLSSSDMLCGRANRHLQHLNIDACYELTSCLMERDPYHSAAILLHVACCVEKKKTEELFSLGHALVNSAPNSALSWYVVGCYYLSINKHQSTRKYLTKAITLQPNFGHAHIAFGLSFATEGEHDQAISAFSSAARTMKGSHLPLLYLGMEYHQTGVVETSTRFMKSAFDLCPHDPYLLQEIGYIIGSMGTYPKAERYFRQAVLQLQGMDPNMTLPAWGALYNNLGHVLRKQGKLDEALQAHHNALQLDRASPSSLTAIAFVHLLREEFASAIEHASQSLLHRRGDQFTLEVLHSAMQEVGGRPFLDPLPPDLSDINEGAELCEAKMVLRPHPQQQQQHNKEGKMVHRPHPQQQSEAVAMNTD